MLRVKGVKCGQETIDIHIDESTGKFVIFHNEDRIESDTLAEAEAAAKTAAKRSRVRIAVPATLLERSWNTDIASLNDITITGRHSRNDNVLYQDAKTGKSMQGRARSSRFLRRLTAEEKQSYLDNDRRIREADKARRKFEEDYTLDVAKAIEGAYKEAEKGAGAEKSNKRR